MIITPHYPQQPIDPVADAEICNRVKELRSSLTGSFKKSGNFGYARVDIPGIEKKEFYAHSSIDELSETLAERVPDISLIPPNPLFEALNVNSDNIVDGENSYSRAYDTEYKILNDLASRLGDNNEAAGTIRLFTDRMTCPSCTRVINTFMEKYPRIGIDVIHNNGKVLR